MSSVEIVEISEDDKDDDCVLESIMHDDSKIKNKDKNGLKEKTFAKNPLLREFVETCLNVENSEGMKRAISRTFLNIYRKADKDYKKSHEFEKSLRRAINLVKNDPGHKFSHLRDLCDILRSGKFKKRVQLITLSNNIKDKKTCKRRSENESNGRFSKTETIDLNLIEDFSIDIDNIDEENLTQDDIPVNSTKENDTCTIKKDIDENNLPVSHSELEFCKLNPAVMEKIKIIEEEIATCKKVIAKLDEEEVCNDSSNSPYIQSEKYKARIISLYKELCALTGDESTKRSKIHLKVIDGHPAGPVRVLETFLNRNVGSNGYPPFPTFRDVVVCVLKANEKDSLGWSNQKIVNEAGVLFTHCGRALQKRRQRREWRDLLSQVQLQDCAPDPADSDPALLARLEANRLDALRKETEILERYSRMQNAPPKSDSTVIKPVKNAHEDSNGSDNNMDTSSDESYASTEMLNVRSPSQIASTSNNEHEDATMHVNIEQENIEVNVINIKKEPESSICQLLEQLGENYTTSVIEMDDSTVVVDISDSSDEESE